MDAQTGRSSDLRGLLYLVLLDLLDRVLFGLLGRVLFDRVLLDHLDLVLVVDLLDLVLLFGFHACELAGWAWSSCSSR